MESQVNLEGRDWEAAADRGDVITGGWLGGDTRSGPVGTGEGTFEQACKEESCNSQGNT